MTNTAAKMFLVRQVVFRKKKFTTEEFTTKANQRKTLRKLFIKLLTIISSTSNCSTFYVKLH